MVAQFLVVNTVQTQLKAEGPCLNPVVIQIAGCSKTRVAYDIEPSETLSETPNVLEYCNNSNIAMA